MRRKRPPRALGALSAAMAWNQLGLRWVEMMAASGSVIAHRTRRNSTPAQLFEMGSEKVQAAVEASHAMTRAMLEAPSTTPLAWARLLGSGMAPFHARALRNARASRRSR